MSCRHWILLALATLVLAASLGQSADDDALKPDLAALKAGGTTTDNKGLLDFIRKRTISEVMRVRIAALIRDLGHDEYGTRSKAQSNLIEIGAPARPQLRAALSDTDLEIRVRARRALAKIGSPAAEAQLVSAAARVLGARKASGACEVLLDFLPSIEEPETAEEVAAVLPGLAMKDGKPEPALVKALSDKYPVKRWAAAAALARAGGKDQRAAVHKVLGDAEPTVRRHVALALLAVKDKEGIAALITLLNGSSAADAEAAEDVLVSIAGEKAPPQPSAELSDGRDRYRKSWEGWWKDNKASLDMARIDLNPIGHGFTVVGTLQFNVKRGGLANGKIQVLGPDLKMKWQIDKVNYPVYACLTRRDRVLVCEYNTTRVTEFDSKGKVVFQKALTSQPVSAQRLANGNTFIVTRNQLLEVDRAGKQVKTINRPTYDIVSARRNKDGTFVMLSSMGKCIKLDSAGRETGSFTTGPIYYSIGLKVHFLPGGGVVIPDFNTQRVREFDSAGKRVRDFAATRPTSVTKLPNGGYMVCSRYNSTLAEFDKNGRQTATHSIPTGGARAMIFAERK